MECPLDLVGKDNSKRIDSRARWGLFGSTEMPSGCPWRFRGARGKNPWRFLLEPRYRGEREGTHLKEEAPPATIRDPGRGDCEVGSWQVAHWALGEWCGQYGAASCKSVVPGNIRRCYCLVGPVDVRGHARAESWNSSS